MADPGSKKTADVADVGALAGDEQIPVTNDPGGTPESGTTTPTALSTYHEGTFLKLDASNDPITGDLDIQNSANSGTGTDSRFVLIESINRSAALGITANSSFFSILRFGDESDADVGRLQYGHAADTLAFFVGAAQRALLSTSKLEVNGSLQVDEAVETNDTTVTTTTHATGAEHVIEVDDDTAGGAVAITLTTAAARHHHIVKTGSTGSVTLTPSSGTINGSASKTLSAQWDAIHVYCNGTNWRIL